MNDFYGYVVHQDRMADMRRDADAARRAARRPARAQRPRPTQRRVAAGILAAAAVAILVLVASVPDAAASGSDLVPAFRFADLVVTLGF